MVAPASGAHQVLPRDLTVLVDHSGSMDGPKRDAADWAVGQLAGMLNQQDRFSLCTFHSTTRWFSEGPRSMDARTRSQMQFFLERYRDGGGTELGVALEQALCLLWGRFQTVTSTPKGSARVVLPSEHAGGRSARYL